MSITPTIIDKDAERLPSSDTIEVVTPKLLDTIKQYQGDWWEVWHDMLMSTDPLERKIAVQEYNKLQLRSMPNELAITPGGNSDGSIAMGVIMLPKRFTEDISSPEIQEEISKDFIEQATHDN
jgi:hypothetical protein